MTATLKNLYWVGSAKKDLRAMPGNVQDVFGYALNLAQQGKKYQQAKPLKGFGGAGVLGGESKMIEIDKGSGNVYSDLEYTDAEEMKVKACLASKIGEIIKYRHLTQTQAAEILGMTQPKLSGMLRGQFRGIGETKMLECLNRLGQSCIKKNFWRIGICAKLNSCLNQSYL